MILKEFRYNIVLRVVIITGLALLLSYVITNKEWFFTPLVLVLLLLISIWSLIYYIEKTNKDLTYFILSIKQSGFTTSFPPGKKGKTFRKLSQAFNDVIEEFRKINLQRETHYQYLQTLTENIQAGIISFDETGKIELANPAALQLLGTLRLRNINEIKRINAKLFQAINDLMPGQRQLFRTVIAKKEVHLSVQIKELVMNEVPYKIMLVQDLNQEMEEQEVDAWQKLIRVLTHEIMNSVTPIVSLTEAVNTMLTESDGERRKLEHLDEEDKEDLFGSLETIEKRSKGLLRFVNAYKDFTKTPEIVLSQVDVGGLIKHVLNLLNSELVKNQIAIDKTGVEDHFMAKADASWMEQVIINVIRNAIDALEHIEDPRLKIVAFQDGNRNCIAISDNGGGMDKGTLDNIFVPFFTTKKNGTGVGLSLSKQIMKLHKGSLNVTSELGKGTIVMMEW
ncbi:MAG: ATP-binding protein [Cyclobacteriaceae bacterium]